MRANLCSETASAQLKASQLRLRMVLANRPERVFKANSDVLCIKALERQMHVQLGECQFANGITRPVHRSGDGRQFVLDEDGEPVYGV